MRIYCTIGYWTEEVLTFDPEKVLDRVKKYFPKVEIAEIDYSRREVEKITEFANENLVEPNRSIIINQIYGKNRANGPSFKFNILIDENMQVNGQVQRYSVSFKSEKDFDLEIEKTIIDFLKSLKYGKIKSNKRTENFIKPGKDSKDYWLLAETNQDEIRNPLRKN